MRFFQGLERAGREMSSALLGSILNIPKVSLPDLQKAFDHGEIRKILLVRNYQGMGDLLCTTPVIASLKTRFPDASIHFLANTFNAAAIANHPALEKVWTWDERQKASPQQWHYFRTRLKHQQFDLALVLSGNALSLTAILLADLSGARWVVGYETKAYGQSWGPRLYSYEVPMPAVAREIDKYAGLIEGLGIGCPNHAPEFFIKAEQTAFAESFWRDHFAASARPVVGIFLGGKVDRPDRIWPPDHFALVARALVEHHGCDLVIIAPPGKAKKAAHKRDSTFWLDESVHERKFRNAYGKDCPVFRDADLGRVGAILKMLNLFICPDGGMMHVAGALRVPTLTLFFGTDPQIWNPPVPTSHYLRGSGHDPQTLNPDAVTQKAREILGL